MFTDIHHLSTSGRGWHLALCFATCLRKDTSIINLPPSQWIEWISTVTPIVLLNSRNSNCLVSGSFKMRPFWTSSSVPLLSYSDNLVENASAQMPWQECPWELHSFQCCVFRRTACWVVLSFCKAAFLHSKVHFIWPLPNYFFPFFCAPLYRHRHAPKTSFGELFLRSH